MPLAPLSCASKHVDHWERNASRGRPAFSCHLICLRTRKLEIHMDVNRVYRDLEARKIKWSFGHVVERRAGLRIRWMFQRLTHLLGQCLL